MNNLRKLREAKGLSQEELGAVFGIKQAHISAYELGVYAPRLALLMEMADYFGTSMDYICRRTDLSRPIEQSTDYRLDKVEQYIINSFRDLTPDQQELCRYWLSSLRLK